MFEINLVPDIKAKALRTQKIRNLIMLLSGGVIAACVAVIMVLGGVKAGQDIKMATQDDMLTKLSAKITGYNDLGGLLSIQKQLAALSTANDQKVLLSRIFNIVKVILPTNGDEITLSELSVNLEEGTMTFEAQADAKTEPYIDYRVLLAFRESMGLMRYDYGDYVDASGNIIPEVCVVEVNSDGDVLKDDQGRLYALWARAVNGCDPSSETYTKTVYDEETGEYYEEEYENDGKIEIRADDVAEKVAEGDYVQIYRTPLFSMWFDEDNPESGEITSEGMISGVPHFESQCISYRYIEGRWTSENVCNLMGEEGMVVNDSNNAKDADGTLVLRFSAIVQLNMDALLAKNKHMISIAPSGYVNMTDSYQQIQGMFAQEPTACGEDEACYNNKQNSGEDL